MGADLSRFKFDNAAAAAHDALLPIANAAEDLKREAAPAKKEAATAMSTKSEASPKPAGSFTPHNLRVKELTSTEKRFRFPAVTIWRNSKELTANANYCGHPIVVTKNNGERINFKYVSENNRPEGERKMTKRNVDIDENFTTLDGSKNGRYKRRRLGWKPSHDIPRRREGFHHLFNRVI